MASVSPTNWDVASVSPQQQRSRTAPVDTTPLAEGVAQSAASVLWELLLSNLELYDVGQEVKFDRLSLAWLVDNQQFLYRLLTSCVIYGRGATLVQLLPLFQWSVCSVGITPTGPPEQHIARLLAASLWFGRRDCLAALLDAVHQHHAAPTCHAILTAMTTVFGLTVRQVAMALSARRSSVEPCRDVLDHFANHDGAPAATSSLPRLEQNPQARIATIRPLHSVVVWTHQDVVRSVQHADNNDDKLDRVHALFLAVREGDLADITLMIDDWKVDPTHQHPRCCAGMSTLQYAVMCKRTEVALWLVNRCPALVLQRALCDGFIHHWPLTTLLLHNDERAEQSPLLHAMLDTGDRLTTAMTSHEQETWTACLSHAVQLAMETSQTAVLELLKPRVNTATIVSACQRHVAIHHGPTAESSFEGGLPRLPRPPPCATCTALLFDRKACDGEAPRFVLSVPQSVASDLWMRCVQTDQLSAIIAFEHAGADVELLLCPDVSSGPPHIIPLQTRLVTLAARAGALSVLQHYWLHSRQVDSAGSTAGTSCCLSLHDAVRLSVSPTVLRYLLTEEKAHVLACDDTGTTPLHLAAATGQRDAVDVLILAGRVPVDVRAGAPARRRTALHFAALNRDVAMIQHLWLKHDADIDARDDEGATALHLACDEGHKSTIAGVLACGADTELRDCHGLTPLACVLRNGNFVLAHRLVHQQFFALTSVVCVPEIASTWTALRLILDVYLCQRRGVTAAESEIVKFFIRNTVLPQDALSWSEQCFWSLVGPRRTTAADPGSSEESTSSSSVAYAACSSSALAAPPLQRHGHTVLDDILAMTATEPYLLLVLLRDACGLSLGDILTRAPHVMEWCVKQPELKYTQLWLQPLATHVCWPTRVWERVWQQASDATVEFVLNVMLDHTPQCRGCRALCFSAAAQVARLALLIKSLTIGQSSTPVPVSLLATCLVEASAHDQRLTVQYLLEDLNVNPWLTPDAVDDHKDDHDGGDGVVKSSSSCDELAVVRALRRGQLQTAELLLQSMALWYSKRQVSTTWTKVAKALPPVHLDIIADRLTDGEALHVILHHVKRGLLWAGLRDAILVGIGGGGARSEDVVDDRPAVGTTANNNPRQRDTVVRLFADPTRQATRMARLAYTALVNHNTPVVSALLTHHKSLFHGSAVLRHVFFKHCTVGEFLQSGIVPMPDDAARSTPSSPADHPHSTLTVALQKHICTWLATCAPSAEQSLRAVVHSDNQTVIWTECRLVHFLAFTCSFSAAGSDDAAGSATGRECTAVDADKHTLLPERALSFCDVFASPSSREQVLAVRDEQLLWVPAQWATAAGRPFRPYLPVDDEGKAEAAARPFRPYLAVVDEDVEQDEEDDSSAHSSPTHSPFASGDDCCSAATDSSSSPSGRRSSAKQACSSSPASSSPTTTTAGPAASAVTQPRPPALAKVSQYCFDLCVLLSAKMGHVALLDGETLRGTTLLAACIRAAKVGQCVTLSVLLDAARQGDLADREDHPNFWRTVLREVLVAAIDAGRDTVLHLPTIRAALEQEANEELWFWPTQSSLLHTSLRLSSPSAAFTVSSSLLLMLKRATSTARNGQVAVFLVRMLTMSDQDAGPMAMTVSELALARGFTSLAAALTFWQDDLPLATSNALASPAHHVKTNDDPREFPKTDGQHNHSVTNNSVTTTTPDRLAHNDEQKSVLLCPPVPTNALVEQTLSALLGTDVVLDAHNARLHRSLGHVACFYGDVAFLRQYCGWMDRQGADWTDACDGNKRTLLHWACLLNAPACVRLLIECAAESTLPLSTTSPAPVSTRLHKLLHARDAHGCVALMYACSASAPDCAHVVMDAVRQWLLLGGAQTIASRAAGDADNHHRQSASRLLQLFPTKEDVMQHWKTTVGCQWSPVHMAAAVDSVDCLLALTRPVPHTFASTAIPIDKSLRCPLQVAAVRDSVRVLGTEYMQRLGVLRRASVDVVGRGVLHLAAKHDSVNALATLLRREANGGSQFVFDVRQVDDHGQTPFHCAASWRTLRVLLDADRHDWGVNGSKRVPLCAMTDNVGKTILHTTVARLDCIPMVRRLLGEATRHGYLERSLLQLDSSQHATALLIATRHNRVACTGFLAHTMRLAKLDWCTRDKAGMSPLDVALSADNVELVRALVPTAQDLPVEPNSNGYLPVHVAAKHGSMRVFAAGVFSPNQFVDVRTFTPTRSQNGEKGLAVAHIAAEHGQAGVLLWMMRQDMTAELLDVGLTESGARPIHVAVASHHIACVRALLDCMVVQRDILVKRKREALEAAAPVHRWDAESLQLLAEEERTLWDSWLIVPRMKTTVFHCALLGADEAALRTIRVLLEYPAVRQYVDHASLDTKLTPVMRAVQERFTLSLVALMTSGGANGTLHDNDGMTVLHQVVTRADLRLIAKLKELQTLGVPVHVRTSTGGDTVLHLAAQVGWWEGVQFMVETWQLSTLTENNARQRPSFLASAAGFDRIAKYLRRKERAEQSTAEVQGQQTGDQKVEYQQTTLPLTSSLDLLAPD